MPESYENITLKPPIGEWSSLLSGASADLLPTKYRELRQSARRRLVDCAEQFVLRLSDIAARSGLPPMRQPLLTGDPDRQRIVMTGHQPVIFHPGIVFKYQATEKFAAEHHAIGVAVVMDSDEGDAGEYQYPVPSDHHSSRSANRSADGPTALTEAMLSADDTDFPRVMDASASLSKGSSLEKGRSTGDVYCRSELADAKRVLADRTLVLSELAALKIPVAAATFQRVMDDYASLKTSSMLDANLIVRWQHGIGASLLELPFTAICQFPEVQIVVRQILSAAREFVELHNRLLDNFRRNHNIRNTANPFPNLQVTSDSIELPFWVLNRDTGDRTIARLVAGKTGDQLFAGDVPVTELSASAQPLVGESISLGPRQLIPRGAMITLVLRMLFSDLFVHGLGGGKYDEFTSQLMAELTGSPASPCAIASASRYLFATSRRECQRLEAIAAKLRDLTFNPHRHLGTGVYSPALDAGIRQRVIQKTSLLEQMKTERAAGQSTKSIDAQIRRLGEEIGEFVAAEFEPQLKSLRELTPMERQALDNRTMPWFFFEPASI